MKDVKRCYPDFALKTDRAKHSRSLEADSLSLCCTGYLIIRVPGQRVGPRLQRRPKETNSVRKHLSKFIGARANSQDLHQPPAEQGFRFTYRLTLKLAGHGLSSPTGLPLNLT